jgi:signal peptidase I
MSHLEQNEITIEESSSSKKAILSKIKLILYTVITAILLRLFVIEVYSVPTRSMASTIIEGDYLVVNKFIYGISTPRYLPFTNVEIPRITFPAFIDPRRGDIIVFNFPGNKDEVKSLHSVNFIKRCVAIPGDTIQIDSGNLYVNRCLFPFIKTVTIDTAQSNFADEDMFPGGASNSKNNYGPIVVPKRGDKKFIDSKNINQWKVFIEREGHRVRIGIDNSILIDGKEVDSYTVEKNYYFMLGDNRDDSFDSRYWGFLSENDIIGKAVLIYWSWNQNQSSNSLLKKLSNIRWSRIGTLVQ